MVTSPRHAIRQTRPPAERASKPHGSKGTRQRTHHERFARRHKGETRQTDRGRPSVGANGQPTLRCGRRLSLGTFQNAPTAESWHSARAANGSRGFAAVDRTRAAVSGAVPPARFQDRGVGNPEMRGRRPDPGASGKGLAGIRTVGAGLVLAGGGRKTILASYLSHQTNAGHSRLSFGLWCIERCRVLELT